MGFYHRHVLPRLIESACRQPPLMALRRRFVPEASGRVLEIGIGSGHNLPLYRNVDSVIGLEPHPGLIDRARARAGGLGSRVEFVEASAESIPAGAASFDSIVCTWTLCSIADPSRALAEMLRVLKPAGRLVFIEHGLSPDERVMAWQRRLNPLWKRIGGGCHLDRDVPRLLVAAGFDLPTLEAGYVPGPRFAAYMYRGVAWKTR